MKEFCEDLLRENNHPASRQLNGKVERSRKWYQIREQVKVARVPQQICPKLIPHPSFRGNETAQDGDQQSENFHLWMSPSVQHT